MLNGHVFSPYQWAAHPKIVLLRQSRSWEQRGTRVGQTYISELKMRCVHHHVFRYVRWSFQVVEQRRDPKWNKIWMNIQLVKWSGWWILFLRIKEKNNECMILLRWWHDSFALPSSRFKRFLQIWLFAVYTSCNSVINDDEEVNNGSYWTDSHNNNHQNKKKLTQCPSMRNAWHIIVIVIFYMIKHRAECV